MPHWLRLVAFLVPVLLLVAALHVFVYRRVRGAFALSRAGRVALGLLLFSGPVALLTARSVSRGALEGFGPAVEALAVHGSIVTIGALLAALLLAPLALFERLTGLIARVSSALRVRRGSSDPVATVEAPVDARPPEPSVEGALVLPRRTFLVKAVTGGAVLAGGGTSFYGGLFGRHDYALEEVPIRLPGLPRSLDGYTLVQLSDIHIGAFVQEPELRAAEALVRRARPDLVVLTGDLLDHDPAYAPKLGVLARRLGALARDGVVAIPGNHDYYAGLEAVLGTLRAAGTRLLVNAGEVVGRGRDAFALLGVDDVWAQRDGLGGPDLDRALAMVPRDLPRVLLCHNPELFPEVAERVDLQLSGHTHGGQINFGVNSAELVFDHGYVRGHYHRGASQIYVNRGFGTAGPPSRIRSAPEVTRIVLTAS